MIHHCSFGGITALFYIPGSEIGIGVGIEFASAFSGIIIGFTTALREIGYVCASKLENSLIWLSIVFSNKWCRRFPNSVHCHRFYQNVTRDWITWAIFQLQWFHKLNYFSKVLLHLLSCWTCLFSFKQWDVLFSSHLWCW